jgi:DNA-binding IclR family transcriptional regulator
LELAEEAIFEMAAPIITQNGQVACVLSILCTKASTGKIQSNWRNALLN